MKNKILIIVITIIITTLFFLITSFIVSISKKEDYQKLGLDIYENDIEYYTVYNEDSYSTYKVYKIKQYQTINAIKEQLESNELWSKNQYYEYIMKRFYEWNESEIIEANTEDLYYYYGNGGFAILDVKKAKLYYSCYPLTLE